MERAGQSRPPASRTGAITRARRTGSAFGTTAEEGTESPPPLESLQKFIAPSDLWPIGKVWDYHAGKPKSVFDYCFTGRVVAYNSTLTARAGLTATATLYNIPDLPQQYTTQVTNLTVPADAATNVLSVPAVSGLSPTYFIRLQLEDSTTPVP